MVITWPTPLRRFLRISTESRFKEAGIKVELSGKPDSCWTATAPKTAYPKFQGLEVVDVAIVGAGIVGLTTASLLIDAGLSVVVVEARRIGRQVTGRSTAKITAQHSLIYRHLIETFDLDTAQRYADANRTGMQQVSYWVDHLGIDCDYAEKDAYAYISNASGISDLEAEADAAAKVGFESDLLDSAPLPFKTVGALRFRGQAQFNPAQYLVGLAKATAAAGARVFEQSRVTRVDDSNGWQLAIGQKKLRAKSVVLATNLPIAGPIPYDERTRPRSHIAMAFRVDFRAAIDGMFIGIDEPKRSLRMGRDDDGPLLVILGSKFDTGHEGAVAKRFLDLETWTRQNLDVGDVAWRWVNEDYDTADRVPFAGRVAQAPHLYVATGFNAWGISNGTAAGILIADQILGRAPYWASVYDPMRKTPKKYNKGGDSQSLVQSLDDIGAGEGGVMNLGKGKIAVWKDTDGHPRAVSASCTHKGCTVTWNNADQTWDCPCHGSIFATDGSVIHGPAVEPLARRKLPPNWLRHLS
jgi:glycine/D-amino acid oxidase-like deaminating enzyme/nitrite reductase/ring-hydroxylating ferredoxin subunit